MEMELAAAFGRLIVETSVVLGAVTVVGSGLAWTFREKFRAWVRAQTQSVRIALDNRVSVLEEHNKKHEGELMRVAESMERISETMNESMKRQTTALERIIEKHEETSLAVARIEGSLERRRHERD